ncbi:hypothetical protein FGU65_08540 [Methanoculleus sp. FWC-SCC1]|uniref:ABC transporter substrate-binding protein n=1 Tax=Methanoculleus frigidifontis TaxID=2584085 RepID=A0ABT8MAH0_9EURY|nr:hypothetical protein [Methanoculleus sp. FWC-SCC1]MDN7024933.1 hypothetical protein [Methanoculleus sp. FWC-SCC1]
MVKRLILVILLMIMAAAVLVTGCVSPAGNETPTVTPTETIPAETTSVMTPEATPMETIPAETTTAAVGVPGY